MELSASERPKGFRVEFARDQVPALLKRADSGRVYLDSAASALTWKAAIWGARDYDEQFPTNVHRSWYPMADRAASRYEHARQQVASFIGADPSEVIFTSGTTDSINLVAQSYASHFCCPGDVILATQMEHHSNILPWTALSAHQGVKLVLLPTRVDGGWDQGAFVNLVEQLGDKLKLVAFTGMSNVTGAMPPLDSIYQFVKSQRGDNAPLLVDGSQLIAHHVVEPHKFCDFFAFSSHKLGGPTGIGALWVDPSLMDIMRPSKFGGGMVNYVNADLTAEWAEGHLRFEAGTPPIAQAIGFGAVCEFLQQPELLGWMTHEWRLGSELHSRLPNIDGVRVLGNSHRSSPICSFVIDGMDPGFVTQALIDKGFDVRGGAHCAWPYTRALGVSGSTRASIAMYNTQEEIDRFIAAVEEVAHSRVA